jgi:50S ribosomal protein L16 3-hydroxylase
MLAMEDDAEIRLITQQEPGNDESYELKLGPLDDEEICRLFDQPSASIASADDDSDSKSTQKNNVLIINDVDRFLPALSDWMANAFSFIPNWRRDDGQMSYSNAGAGIGRHVDNYDVFCE